MRSILFIFLAATACAQFTPAQKADNLDSFEQVWSTVRDRSPDATLHGLNWQAVHDSTRPQIANARSMDEVRGILTEMLAKLKTSHYAIMRAIYINRWPIRPRPMPAPGSLLS